MENLLGIGSRINHSTYGKGVITNVDTQSYWVTFIDKGLEVLPFHEEFEVIEAEENELDVVSFYEVEKSLREILQKWGGISEVVPLGDRWKGGTLVLHPEDESLSSKEIPIETFFHKIVMLRDRLRVMEQKINANKTLSDEEKVDLQQYITRCYGSLTTFNVLFKVKSQQFKGSSKK